MAESQPEKMEKDWSVEVNKLISAKGSLDDFIQMEKQTRNSADLRSNARVLIYIVQTLFDAKEYEKLNEYIQLLTKKRALLKQAVTEMIQTAIAFIEKMPEADGLKLIQTIREVTDGKIFVEVERARVTRTLAKKKESEGNIIEACDLMQELQVETYGSMDKQEKTDFILEQIRLCMLKKDFTRAQIVSKKISAKFFKDEKNDPLKIRFYRLMINHALHSNDYLKICKFFRELYNTKSVKEDGGKEGWQYVLGNIVIYAILSPHDNEQHDLLYRIEQEELLSKLPLFSGLLKCFTTKELMRWSKMEEIYGSTLKQLPEFSINDAVGKKRYEDFHKRIIEHNIRVIASYYSRITMKKLCLLLDLSAEASEEFLSSLVVKKTVYARIDRLSGVVTFEPRKDANEILNNWSSTVHSLLDLIVKTNHLIMKEEMVHQITRQID